MDRKLKPVKWTSRSLKDLKSITEFYIELYSSSKTREIITNIRKSTEVLERENPESSEIGSVDTAFNHPKFEYRKLTNHYCKITYRIGKDDIYIVRVFDLRQNPKKNL
ncbi:plasmid stabilization protein [Nonlabens spongiae]|uniref:Plasmid stabilization protein n=1 Tax=Nonlabens spongiae TaxID=331648 RepID=A0A1W6MNR0_9FLAO|nr:type II toxin-antitoxin system RelE/ParE family toxin [Nonlabens spongiae]ARN79207.1 plasmid stabilization protein [Nonlabens spongiae]